MSTHAYVPDRHHASPKLDDKLAHQLWLISVLAMKTRKIKDMSPNDMYYGRTASYEGECEVEYEGQIVKVEGYKCRGNKWGTPNSGGKWITGGLLITASGGVFDKPE